MTEVTRDEAIRFLENALRNWDNVQFDNDDLEDVRGALQRFAKTAEQRGYERGLRHDANLMLLEGAQDAVAALQLIQRGIAAQLPMGKAQEVVASIIDELEFAIRARLSAPAILSRIEKAERDG